VKTPGGRAAIVEEVPEMPTVAERLAHRQFAEALAAFAVDPGPDNLDAYLAASRSLEEARRRRQKAAKRRPQLVPETGSP
jgi:hypothetical protein